MIIFINNEYFLITHSHDVRISKELANNLQALLLFQVFFNILDF
jgi:hypothetical protein